MKYTKILALFVLLILILQFLPGCSSSVSDTDDIEVETKEAQEYNPDDTMDQIAEKFADNLVGRHYADCMPFLSGEVKKSLPEKTLRDSYEGMLPLTGKYEKIVRTDYSYEGGYHIYVVTVNHKKQGMTIRIVLNEDKKVAGLWFNYAAKEDADKSLPDGIAEEDVIVDAGTGYPLKGKLTLPSLPSDSKNLLPAVVLVHGSGSTDMNETIYGNRPFKDIAHALAGKGIAVLRYDKRTYTYGAKAVEEFGGGFTVYEETIEDAVAAAEILKSDPRINKEKVFIIGHSMGGMLAPRIHAEGGNFAGIISLAGSPRSINDILYDQQMAYVEAMPDGDEKNESLALLDRELYDAAVAEILNLPDDEAKKTPAGGGAAAYYYKDWERIPTPEYVKDISVPFLILQGKADFQVYYDKDFVLWQELLAGRSNAAFKLYDGLNHLFMPATDSGIIDADTAYSTPAHVDKTVCNDIAEWILKN